MIHLISRSSYSTHACHNHFQCIIITRYNSELYFLAKDLAALIWTLYHYPLSKVHCSINTIPHTPLIAYESDFHSDIFSLDISSSPCPKTFFTVYFSLLYILFYISSAAILGILQVFLISESFQDLPAWVSSVFFTVAMHPIYDLLGDILCFIQCMCRPSQISYQYKTMAEKKNRSPQPSHSTTKLGSSHPIVGCYIFTPPYATLTRSSYSYLYQHCIPLSSLSQQHCFAWTRKSKTSQPLFYPSSLSFLFCIQSPENLNNSVSICSHQTCKSVREVTEPYAGDMQQALSS